MKRLTQKDLTKISNLLSTAMAENEIAIQEINKQNNIDMQYIQLLNTDLLHYKKIYAIINKIIEVKRGWQQKHIDEWRQNKIKGGDKKCVKKNEQ